MQNTAGHPGHNAGQLHPAEILTPGEVDRLVAAASARSSTGLRTRALILVMHRAGLRIGEALSLEPSDVCLDLCTVRVKLGADKGRRRKADAASPRKRRARSRTVALEPGACAAVAQWLDRRRKLGISPRAPLFCTLTGDKALYPQQVRAQLGRLAVRAGLDKRVHPHALRHGHAAHLDRSGVPVSTIQASLGHTSLAVTSRYLAGLGQEEHLERVRRVDWGSGGPEMPQEPRSQDAEGDPSRVSGT